MLVQLKLIKVANAASCPWCLRHSRVDVHATQVASPAIIGGEMMAKYVLQSGQK